MKKILFCITILLSIVLLEGCNSKSNEVEISLDGAISDGYNWSYNTSNDLVLELKEKKYDEKLNISHFIFIPKSEGQVTITFTYKSLTALENDEYQITYDFKVDNNLKITFKNKSGTYKNMNAKDPIIKNN